MNTDIMNTDISTLVEFPWAPNYALIPLFSAEVRPMCSKISENYTPSTNNYESSSEQFEPKTMKISTENLGNPEIAAVWGLGAWASRARWR